MKTFSTDAIILKRTNYGEADRIMTLLSRDYGKLQVIAKGVRKERSKLAGGIELFSVSRVSFIKGKRDLDTLMSTRLIHYYSGLLRDYDTTTIGYACIEWLHASTSEATGPEYFDLLLKAFQLLDNEAIASRLAHSWFLSRLMSLSGYDIDLATDTEGMALDEKQSYEFNFDEGKFQPLKHGPYEADTLKVLRLLRQHEATALQKVQGIEPTLPLVVSLLENALRYYLHLKI